MNEYYEEIFDPEQYIRYGENSYSVNCLANKFPDIFDSNPGFNIENELNR